MTHEQDLTEMRAEVNEHGVLDIDQATELFDRLEATEQALDFHTQRDRELKALLSLLTDRLDEFSYDELSSLIEDNPLDQWGEAYKSRLEQAEQRAEQAVADYEAATLAVQRVRESLSNHPRACEEHPENDAIKCGWKNAVIDVQNALDGES